MSFQRTKNPTEKVFNRLYANISNSLANHGENSMEGPYYTIDDYWMSSQVVVYVQDLLILRPAIVHAMRGIVTRFPGWEIVMVVALDDHDDWPNMGLYIRKEEIIDGLQRDYFPPKYRGYHYEGARPGTEDD